MVRHGHAHHARHHHGGHHHHHHHHHGGITHHHGPAAHHDHHAAHHHHRNVHHHHPTVVSTAVPVGAVARGPSPAAGRGYIMCAIFLVCFGLIFTMTGAIFVAIFDYSSVVTISGICLISVGVIMIIAFAILCKKGKSAQQGAAMALQQSGAVNTMFYGVQPQHPGTFGQPGAPPIVQSAPVTPIVYGPSGEVSYYPATQTEIPYQPYGNTEPGTTHDSEDFVVMSDGHQVEPTAPVDSPPSYDDVISKDTPTDD